MLSLTRQGRMSRGSWISRTVSLCSFNAIHALIVGVPMYFFPLSASKSIPCVHSAVDVSGDHHSP